MKTNYLIVITAVISVLGLNAQIHRPGRPGASPLDPSTTTTESLTASEKRIREIGHDRPGSSARGFGTGIAIQRAKDKRARELCAKKKKTEAVGVGDPQTILPATTTEPPATTTPPTTTTRPRRRPRPTTPSTPSTPAEKIGAAWTGPRWGFDWRRWRDRARARGRRRARLALWERYREVQPTPIETVYVGQPTAVETIYVKQPTQKVYVGQPTRPVQVEVEETPEYEAGFETVVHISGADCKIDTRGQLVCPAGSYIFKKT